MIVDIIIQARMGSTRFPGKVLKKLNGITQLESVLSQLNYSVESNQKIIATSTNYLDDPISELATKNDWNLFRGDEVDVLDRYYKCAKKYSLEHIVRITADNPLIDPTIVDNIICVYKKNIFDYVSNCEKRTYPYGTEVEVFSFDALETAWKNAKNSYEREHVTPYIITHPEIFKKICVTNSSDLSKYSWTVDTEKDFERIKTLYTNISSRPILMKDILDFHKNNLDSL